MTVGEYLEGKLGKRELNKLVDGMYARCVKEDGPPVRRKS